jgi:hypothetical protein
MPRQHSWLHAQGGRCEINQMIGRFARGAWSGSSQLKRILGRPRICLESQQVLIRFDGFRFFGLGLWWKKCALIGGMLDDHFHPFRSLRPQFVPEPRPV